MEEEASSDPCPPFPSMFSWPAEQSTLEAGRACHSQAGDWHQVDSCSHTSATYIGLNGSSCSFLLKQLCTCSPPAMHRQSSGSFPLWRRKCYSRGHYGCPQLPTRTVYAAKAEKTLSLPSEKAAEQSTKP